MVKHYIVLGCALFLGSPALADEVGTTTGNTPANLSAAPQTPQTSATQTPATPTQAATEDSPEDKAYKAAMIKISDAIIKKIAEIQAKQKEIDNEVYLASKPPLIAEKETLEAQLRDLEMTRDKMQSEKTARDMTNQLKKPGSSTSQ